MEKYIYKNKKENILISVGKQSNNFGEVLYFAKTDYKGIISLAECKEKALENCMKKIKFAINLSEKKIELMNQNQAIILGKKYFEMYNGDRIEKYKNNLSYNVHIEDDLLTLNVTFSDNSPCSYFEKIKAISVVYVNMVTGECDIVERVT